MWVNFIRTVSEFWNNRTTPKNSIIMILFFLICATFLYGYKDVWSSFTRRFNIVKGQFIKTIRSLLGHTALLIALFCFIRLAVLSFNHPNRLLNVSYNNSSGESSINVITTNTTLYATLITVLLALIALAVTAHVFLNSALLNRKEYENEQIKNLKQKTTRRMFSICIISGLCITLCLILDNVILKNEEYIVTLEYCAILASFVDIVSLALFINSIVNYEKHLLAYARSYIKVNQKDLVKKLNGQASNYYADNNSAKAASGIIDKEASYIKDIGDLENLVKSILDNHESEFRYQQGMTRDIIFSAIIKKKRTKKRKIYNDITISDGDISHYYRRLIEIRNCLWILQDHDENFELHSLMRKCVLNLELCLLSFAFSNERFTDLNFNEVDFSNGDFSHSSMKNSALLDSKFCNANLTNCDFSDCLLQNIGFQSANCEGAVFTGARIISPAIDEKTNFEKSVLNNCEITMSENETLGGNLYSCFDDGSINYYPYRFQRISCQRTNFVKCSFHGVNFEDSVFKDATVYDAKIVNCNFNRADMERANLSNADIYRLCSFQYANCGNITAVYSNWGVNNINKENDLLDLTGSRFVHANMAFAKLSFCRFAHSYLNDATFTAANINNCCFDGSLLSNTDFTDAKIENCIFSHTVLSKALFIGNSLSTSEDNTIRNTHFDKSEMDGCSIKNIIFNDCTFFHTVLDGSVIRDTIFQGCSFESTHFCDTLMFNVYFEHSTKAVVLRSAIDGLSFGTTDDKSRFEKAFTVIEDKSPIN